MPYQLNALIAKSLLLFVLFLPLVSFAQGEEDFLTDDLLEVHDQVVVVAEVSVQNVQIVSQNETDIRVAFELSNIGQKPQSDIKYGVQLVEKTDAGNFTVDTHVFEDLVTLDALESVAMEVAYTAPMQLSGVYEVWVVSKLTSGMMLGLGKAGEVSLIGQGHFVSIDQYNCRLRVSGDAGVYYLGQGVDVTAQEVLTLTCPVMFDSVSGGTIEVVPSYETYRRNSYGSDVFVPAAEVAPVKLTAVTSANTSFNIPLASEPQAYDVHLVLKDAVTGEVVSDQVTVHYVLRGESATIQSVNLDKAEYVAGEEAVVELHWTPAADSFAESRTGEGTAVLVAAQLSVVDNNGNQCVAERTFENLDSPVHVFTLPVRDSCLSPVVSVRLVEATTGGLLDERIITSPERAESEPLQVSDTATPENETGSTMTYMVVAFVALVVVGSLLVFWRNRRHAYQLPLDDIGGNTTLKSILFLVLMSGGLAVLPSSANAVTFTDRQSTYTVNIDKATYAPGETITMTGSASTYACTNEAFSLSIQARLGSQRNRFVYGQLRQSFVAGSGTLVAPSTPGYYSIRFYGCNASCAVYEYPFTVVAPPPPPPPPPPLPDLVPAFSPVAPMMQGSPISLSGSVVNSSSVVTPAGFFDNFTYQYGGTSGAWNNFAGNVVSHSAFAPGQSAADTVTFIPPLPGSLYLQYCVDAGNSVAEGAGEMPNCVQQGPFTVAAPPSLSFSAVGCANIPVGSNQCTGSVSWNFVSGSPNYRVTNTTTGGLVYSGNSANSSGVPVVLVYGTNVVTAQDNDTLSDTKSVSASCIAGSEWSTHTGTCEVAPSVSLSATPALIRSGSTATIDVTLAAAGSTVECELLNAAATPISFVHTGPSTVVSYPTRPLASTQIVTATCTDTTTLLVGRDEVRVEVVPTTEEI